MSTKNSAIAVTATAGTTRGSPEYYVAPRLAGQQAQYLENQLKAIGKHTRNDPIAKRFMWPVLTARRPASVAENRKAA